MPYLPFAPLRFAMLPYIPAPIEKILDRVPWLKFPVRLGFRFAERWGLDNCYLMAAALAFFGLLSVFPLALAGVAILARALAAGDNTLKDFAEFVGSFFPGSTGEGIEAEIQRSVQAIATGPDAATVSVVALFSLLWAGRAYFDTLATVLSSVWPGAAQRNFIKHQLALWGLMFGSGALFLLSTSATVALTTVQSLAYKLPNLFINRAPVLWDWAGKFSAWGLTLFMFYLLYHYGPNREKPNTRRVVWAAAFVAAVGWELAKWGFTRFLGNVTRYQATYGSVAGIVVTMLWIYASSLIILLGAEVAATYEDVKKGTRDLEAGGASDHTGLPSSSST